MSYLWPETCRCLICDLKHVGVLFVTFHEDLKHAPLLNITCFILSYIICDLKHELIILMTIILTHIRRHKLTLGAWVSYLSHETRKGVFCNWNIRVFSFNLNSVRIYQWSEKVCVIHDTKHWSVSCSSKRLNVSFSFSQAFYFKLFMIQRKSRRLQLDSDNTCCVFSRMCKIMLLNNRQVIFM